MAALRLPAETPGYGVDSWREAEGLPQSRIRAVLQTHDGYVWLGTDNGVVRFNGSTFTSFTVETGSLKDNEVWALKEDSEYALWIGTYGGGLTRYKDGRFDTFTRANGLPDDVVTHIDKDASGALWISTPEGLSRYSRGTFSSFSTADGSSFGPMCVGFRGQVYIATASRVFQFADGRFQPLTDVVREGDSAIEQLLCARDGSLWIGFANAVIRLCKNGRLTTYLPKPTAAPQVTLLYEDPAGGIWSAYGERLHQLRHGAFEPVLLEDGKNLGTVYSMTVDSEGGIWAGLQTGGLVRLRVNRISTIASGEGLPNDSARAVYQDQHGALWVGTASGFGRYLDGRLVPFTEVNGRRLGAVRSFAEDAQGRLWIAAGKDLLLMQKGQLSPFPGWSGHSEIEVIYKDARNCMWIGTDGDGVYQFEYDTTVGGYRGFRNYRERDGLPGNRIRAITEDRNGAMWISVFGIGVARYVSGVFTSYTAASGELAGNRVTAIHADEEGTVWFATRGGLSRLKDGKFFSYTSASGMLANFVYSILDDGKGNFWFSCAQGLFKVSKADLRDYADGRIRKMTSVSYGVRDGMKTRAFNVGNQPAAWKTADGILLFSSMKGVVMVDPGHLAPGNYVPPVYVENVSINKQKVPLNSVARLPQGAGEAEIDYTALSFTDPEKLRFRYMLEGVDTDWVDAGSRRFAYYANLPSGNFRFHVIAGNVDGPWNQHGAVFAFYLTPHFYQTRLFWVAVASGVLLLAWAFYRLHMLEVKARYSAVLGERNRISQDIHDTFAQNLAGIALQLDSMTMQLEEIPEGLRASIDAACNLTRYSLAEARRAVTDLRSDDLDRADLPAALPEIATRLVGTAAVETSIQVSGTPHRLNAVTEKNLLRIFQEAMANALKHSHAETIRIELKYGPDGLALRVKDNGRGFDADRTISLGIGHYGLTGMRERAERIGGYLTLKSAPGEGTELLVEVPFQA